jgi:hypothetical protein
MVAVLGSFNLVGRDMLANFEMEFAMGKESSLRLMDQ